MSFCRKRRDVAIPGATHLCRVGRCECDFHVVLAHCHRRRIITHRHATPGALCQHPSCWLTEASRSSVAEATAQSTTVRCAAWQVGRPGEFAHGDTAREKEVLNEIFGAVMCEAEERQRGQERVRGEQLPPEAIESTQEHSETLRSHQLRSRRASELRDLRWELKEIVGAQGSPTGGTRPRHASGSSPRDGRSSVETHTGSTRAVGRGSSEAGEKRARRIRGG